MVPSAVFNEAIVFCTVLAMAVLVRRVPPEKLPESFRYFTTLSNLFCALTSCLLLLSELFGTMPAWAVAAVIFREFAVSGLRLIAAQKNIVIAAAQSGKIKTACTMVCLGLMLLFLSRPMPLLNGICTGLILVTTLYSGFEYFKNNIQVFKET